MAKCKHCGRSGLFLKLNKEGLCDNCQSTALMEQEQAELAQKKQALEAQSDQLAAQLADQKALFAQIEAEARAAALKNAQQEQDQLFARNHELNLQIAQQQDALNLAKAEEEKAKKNADAMVRKAQRGRALVKAIQHVEDEYESGARPANLDQVSAENDEFIAPTVQLNPQCLDMRELRKRYRQNEKDIQACLDKYKSRYTTKTNSMIYRLMCIALAAELQNILASMSYGRLEDCLAAVTKMTDKYLQIATEGNQSIAPTVKRFIGEIDYYYQEAVKIEYEYYVKKERAKEEQRAIREQMRQEAEERRELERQRKQVEKEESKYTDQISQLQAQLAQADAEKTAALEARIAELQGQLASVAEQKEKIANLQNGKAGNVYIISNLGSFGDEVFKIGMTRRLDPQERVDELGSASVPFPFDVHSMIFSNDAVSLETELHHILNDKRVNKVNLRKEFFHVSLDELEELVAKIAPTAEFKRTMLAEQYRQSLSIGHIEDVDESSTDDDSDEEDE